MRTGRIFQVVLAMFIAATAAGRTAGQSPSFPGRQWELVPPESQDLDERKLRDAVAYLESAAGEDGARELVIVRNGEMIWKGPQADKVHGVWSCTKSFTSTVLGLLVDDGKCSLEDKAARWLPVLESAYPDVTLQHFATMTSGYRAVGDEPQGSYRHGPSRTPFDPAPRPLFSPPGSTYAYWDSAMNQFANVLTRVAQEPLEDVFRRRIAEPIQMDPEKWRWGDFGEVDGMVVNGGAGNQGRHVFIAATEMARFGLLMLNRGNWDGQQLISREWVARATSPQVPADSIGVHPDSGADGRGAYGLNWWANGVKPDGARKWPGLPHDTFAASGFNNNDLFVIPEWKMVVVRLGLDQNDKQITDEQYATFLRMLGDSIEDAPAVQIDEAEYEGRSQFVVRAKGATWYYDRAGGGFSRLIDRDGRDWIAFGKEPLQEFPASAAAGYRGIPNAVFRGPDKGAGHPGFDQCTSHKIADNQIRTVSESGSWAWTWTFKPNSATFRMESVDPDARWWFLYEGPIAGTFAPRNKYWGTDRGGPRQDVPDRNSQLFENWRWIYFGDRDVPRVLFLVQHEPDDAPDTLWYLGSSDGGSADSPDGMVVFGFGRGPGTAPLLEGAGKGFTVGFLEHRVADSADHSKVAAAIEAVMSDALTAAAGDSQR